MSKIASAPVLAPDDMVLSLSEISSLIYRATRGAGYEWGEAEEAAYASVWLSRAGLDWAGTLLGLLSGARADTPLPARGGWTASAPLCPLRTGMALADFAHLPEGPSAEPVVCIAVAHPLLIVPFAARVAASLDRPMRLGWAGVEICLEPEQAPLIEGQLAADKPVDVTLACGDARRAMPIWPQFHREHLRNVQYRDLTDLALRTTVPTSARSQAGAGAAGGDND
ncbi:DUF3726 domain-containing protein [Hoeflea sp.]|uniref:DUF3726 domain-containing protein n=1 Tax=Hoeflea sp. TaxID=1940281 RepID=UPI003749284E